MDSIETSTMAVRLADSGDLPRQISYIHRLPNELLAAIFRAGSLFPKKRYEMPFPELVCMVNGHWRSVAINTPDIWCDIRIPFFRSAETTSLWFERSKSCLLDITFDAPIMRFVSTEHETAFVELVRLHLPRWRRLVIKASSRDEIEDMLVFFHYASAPRLEELHVHVRNPDIGQDGVHTNFLTPSLRSVRLEGVCLHCLPPLVGLTSIEFCGFEPTYSAFRDILTASPSLSHLVFSKMDSILSTVRLDHGLPMIEVPSLRSLALRSVFVYAGPPCACLLCILSMPNLESLEICGDLVPFLIRHFQMDSKRYSAVRTLRLQGISHPSRLDVFRAIPMVNHLQLIDTNDDILVSLVVADGESRDAENDSDVIHPKDRLLWPGLLVVTLDTPHTAQVPLLREVISNRILQGAPLSKIRLARALWTESTETRTWLQERVQVEKIDDDEKGFRDDSESDSDSYDSWESSIYQNDVAEDWNHYDSDEYDNEEEPDEDWGLEGVESYSV